MINNLKLTKGECPNTRKAFLAKWKADGIKNYTQSDVEKKPHKKREVKKDPTKINFIHYLEEWLLTTSVEDVTIVNEQKEIAFRINGEDYSLSLIKHRKRKEV